MVEPPTSVGPLVFEEFLAHLRRQGLTIGVDHHLRLQELLSKIGSECAPGDLKTILCPIFATNANQQKLFYRSFDSYFAVFSQRAARDAFTTSPPTQAKEQATGERGAKTGKRRWPYFVMGGVLAVELLVLAIRVSRIPTVPTPPVPSVPLTPVAPSTPAPTPPAPQTPVPETQTAQPESWVQRHNQSLRLGAVILVPLLLFFSYEWYRLIRRRLVLQRKRGKRPPFSWPIHPEASPSEIYDSTEFYGAARRLQRRQVGESYHLDIEASVKATVDSLGFPRLQYKPDRKLPEYLVLVDRASFRDHQANLFHDLVRALRDEGLYVNLFFFECDPRVCWDEERGDTVPLFELQRRYAGHRLLLLSNGEKLIDALSGSLAGWTSLLLDWKDRGVLTPEPPAHWGLREKALASQFIVLPATTEGLFALGDYFELPSQPDTSGIEKTSADHAPPVPDDPRGIEALRNYLGGGTFRWLAACAVYPELHWDLTLYLGSLSCFGPGLVTEQNLLKLVRLPWFRRGSIPDELRLALIQELGQEAERAVREAIVDLLEKNPAPKETFASDARQFEILFQRYWLDRQNSKKRGDLIRALRGMPDDEVAQNFTLLQSVESVSKSRLDIILPARLRRMLFPSGLSAFGLRSTVRFVATLALIGAGLLVFAPRRVGILTVDVFPIGARISIDGRSDPSWLTPFTFRDLPTGKHTVVISMDGFWNLQKTVTIDGGQISGVEASLFAQTDRPAPGAGQETPEELLKTCKELFQMRNLGGAESYCNRVIDNGGTLAAEAQDWKKRILTQRDCTRYYSNALDLSSRLLCPQAIEIRQKMQQSCSDFSGLETLDTVLQSQCPAPQRPPQLDEGIARFNKGDHRGAQKIFEDLLPAHADLPELQSWHQRAKVEILVEDYKAAVKRGGAERANGLLTELIERAPEDHRIPRLKAQLQSLSEAKPKDREKNRAAAQAALNPNPRDVDANNGKVSFITAPPGLEVVIDGKSLGPSPVDTVLSAGTHSYAVARPGWEPYKGTVMVRSGGTMIVRVNMGGEAAATEHGPGSAVGLCQQMGSLMSKFPFNPQATQDASQDEIKAIFEPASGSLSMLRNAVNKTGQPQGPGFLNFLVRAMNLQRALYSGGPGQIHYKYALRPHPTDTVAGLTMSIDGQPLTYSGGNADFKQFTWPGSTAQGVTLTVKITGGSDLGFPSYDGAWGVFHFFADADKWQQTGSTYNIEWVLRVAGGRPVTAPSGKPVTVQFDLDTLGGPPILQKGYLSSLHCVSSIAK